MKGRNAQVARILSILDLLEMTPGGLSAAEIHDRLAKRGHKAAKRTIYRDLDALSKAGFPLFPEGENESTRRWRLERTTRIHQHLALSAKELFSLFLARGALTPLRATPFFEDLVGIFKKIEDRLATKQVHYLRQLENEVRFEPGPAWGLGINPDILETLRAGCAEGQVIEARYYSVNSKRESVRRMGPQYLYYAQGMLYLVAEDLEEPAAGRVKTFAVPRFLSASLLEEIYDCEPNPPEELFQGGMAIYNGFEPEEIIIEFDSDVAYFVRERRWHPSQRVTHIEEGRLRVQFELGQTPELIAWILGFGPSARVKKPDGLGQKIRDAAKCVAEMYG